MHTHTHTHMHTHTHLHTGTRGGERWRCGVLCVSKTGTLRRIDGWPLAMECSQSEDTTSGLCCQTGWTPRTISGPCGRDLQDMLPLHLQDI